MRKLFLLVVIAMSINGVMAGDHPNRICGSMDNLNRLKSEDPFLEDRMRQIEMFTNVFIQNKKKQNSVDAVITIPVVFHIVYNTSAQNISDAKCQAQINQLNLDFAKLNANASSIPSIWQGIAANTNIQFCLAKRDPNGNSTTGIERRQTTTTSFSTNDNIKRTANGGMNAWPSSSYLNIWSGNLSGGVLGYAQFPGGSAATDGVVLLYSSIGSVSSPGTASPYNLGRTATHEVGHWLNLYHIWGDESGCSGSDNVGDTPNQGAESYGCPTYPKTDACAASSPGVMFMNYMDYTNDACMNMFTNGQSTRMNALFASGGARASLLTSLGCQAPTGSSCTSPSGLTATSITTNSATLNWTAVSGAVSYNIQYKTAAASTWALTTSTTTSKTLTGLTSGTTYQFQVQTICSGSGSTYAGPVNFTTTTTSCTDIYESNNSSSAAKTIGFNTDINALISSSTDVDWFTFTTTAPNTNIKITLTNLPGDFDIKLYNSSLSLLTTAQNGGTTSETIIRNTSAAAKYYVRVYGYNGALSTTQCYKLRVSVAGTAFRFIEHIPAELSLTEVENKFIVYPNPASNIIHVVFNSNQNETVNLRIFDMLGKTIKSISTPVVEGENKFLIDLEDFTKGIYFVELNQLTDRKVKKIVIDK